MGILEATLVLLLEIKHADKVDVSMFDIFFSFLFFALCFPSNLKRSFRKELHFPRDIGKDQQFCSILQAAEKLKVISNIHRSIICGR